MQDSIEREISLIKLFGPALLIVLVILTGFAMFWSVPKKGDVVIIDCSLSEISPDFTVQMREACRQARAKNYQDNLQKPK